MAVDGGVDAAPELNIDLASVLRAARIAALGKRRNPDVAAFLVDIERHALQLVRELSAGTWRPRTPRGFIIREPKLRLISALPFRDRVVQHLLIATTLPAIERSFAPQSYACRKGYGTHRCLRVAAELTRRHGFVLRLDVAKFFPPIDHVVVRRMLWPRTPRAWWPITERIIDAPAHVEPTRFYLPGDDLFAPLSRPHGLPIGNLCSRGNFATRSQTHASNVSIRTATTGGDVPRCFGRPAATRPEDSGSSSSVFCSTTAAPVK